MEIKNKAQRNKIILRSIKVSILLAFYSLVTTPYSLLTPAFAQEALRSITVVPPAIEKSLNPGDKTEGILKVINDTAAPITFKAEIKDFIVQDTQGTPVMLPSNTLTNKYSAASWIGVTPDSFTIQPHQRQQLNYYVQIPTNARPGGHYAAVSYTPEKNLAVQGTGASVETVIGSLFYFTVAGQVNQQATVSKFFGNGFQEYGPVNLHTQIQNQGDLHIKPTGYISVQNMFGAKSFSSPLEEHNIFPQSARDYQNTFGKHWMFGRYKATLNATYTSNNLPLTATVYIWILPWKLILVILLAIIAAVLGILYWKKKKTTTPPAQTTTPPTPPIAK